MEEQVIYSIKRLDNALFRRLLKSMKKFNFKNYNPLQCKIAKILLDNQGIDIYQRDLEKLIGIRRSTVSGILKTMEKNGIIIREDSDEDKRIKKLILTEEAKTQNKEMSGIFKNINEGMIKGISKEELEVFNNVINKLMKNIEEDGKEKEE